LEARPCFGDPWRTVTDADLFSFSHSFAAQSATSVAPKAPSYASMAVCRAIVAFFISPAAAIGSAVVAETFFRKDRARYMGVWTLIVTLGVPVSPFIFGFVAYHVNYRWIFWILAIVRRKYLL
jgi:MFS family permease